MNSKNTLLRNLPAVDKILNDPILVDLAESCPRPLILEATRQVVEEMRRRILEMEEGSSAVDLSTAEAARRAARLAVASDTPSLRPVLNATGTLLHTNLGRAPLCRDALEAITAVARSYSNLEFDLQSGKRGHRFAHVEEILCRLTGAEAAAVVNNNAGAVLLALTALAKGREAVVSRGELVEIGGAFRVPDVMAAGGVRLKEVGTTNKTHPRDYAEAICDQTAMLLKIHTSNYRIVGFTQSVSGEELVPLARERGLVVMEDLGSGMLFDLSSFGLPQEPTVAEAVAAGIDVVTFSGDKLLGGPQAGILVGRKEHIDTIRHHPMARALRIDKLTLAALDATLRLYLDKEKALEQIPVLRMLAVPAEELKRRSERLAARIEAQVPGLVVQVIEEPSQVGGGALPLTELPGFAVALTPTRLGVDELATRLRRQNPPLVGRIQEDRLLLNPRTLAPDQEEEALRVLAAAIAPGDETS